MLGDHFYHSLKEILYFTMNSIKDECYDNNSFFLLSDAQQCQWIDDLTLLRLINYNQL